VALIGEFGMFLADCRLEAQFLFGVTAGLNKQRLGNSFTVSKLKSRFRAYSEDEGSFGGLFR
jgi:hypothetical protein